jgi:hypothetical protein
MVRLADKQGTYVDENTAAAYLRNHSSKYDGLTSEQVLHAHNDPAFLNSLEISGYGAIHMCENDAHKQRIYVGLCHRHYTKEGLTETISAQHRHALWEQKEANRRLAEHGAFMYGEGKELGKIDGFASGHTRGLDVGRSQAKWSFPKWNADAFTGGFVDTFKYIGVVGVALILAVVYLIFVKGKGVR